jgi:tape measure domain-containing protein
LQSAAAQALGGIGTTLFTNARQGFGKIEDASQTVTLSGITKAISNVQSGFGFLEHTAANALGGIAANAASKGAAFAKSFAFQPILDGLHEYQTNLQSIQTIQANTDQPLPKINHALQELNHYSDQTIYNFSEMARNIGTFTAAGVDLKTATSSIKGIANLAALSGSNSQQASTAMYQLSQAISSGRVGLQDWNSVVNAGMGGKKLQNALAQTSIAMGTIKDESVKMSGPMKKLTINGQSFRESISAKPGSKPWLTSEVLVNTLATLDGRFSKAAMSAEKTKDGLNKYTDAQIQAKIADNRAALEKKNHVKYTDEQFASLQKLSDSAFKSATQVKTLGQVFDVAKETIGSGWGASFQSIFGNFKEARNTFTSMSNAVNGFINANALARNKVLHDWHAMGGRTELIKGIKQAFQDLGAILKPIKDAFRDIFPRKTGKDLFEMTKGFTELMRNLKPSKALIDTLHRVFAGLFAVLHIGWSIIKGVVGVIGDLLGVVGKGSGGFMNFAGGVGDFLVSMDKALTKGGALKGFFQSLTEILKTPIKMLMKISGAIFGLFGGGGGDKASKFAQGLDTVSKAAGPVEAAMDRLKHAWKGFVDVLDRAKDAIQPWLTKIGDQFSRIWDVIANAFSGPNLDKTLSVIQTGLMGGLFLAIKKAISGGTGQLGGGLIKNLNGTLGALTGHLKSMQTEVKANIILKIAAAIGILAAGVALLSTIEPKKLTMAMTAVAVGLGQLAGAMKIMTSGMGLKGAAQVPIIAAGMVLLAISVTILAGAMKIFATMKWEDIAKGLAGVGGALSAIAVGMKLLGPGMLIKAAGVVVVAVGLNILALAVKQFANMDVAQLAKGIGAVAIALTSIGIAMDFMPPTMILTGAGLVAVAFALNLLAAAIGVFAHMRLDTMYAGILGVAGSLAAIGIAIGLIPPTVALQAAGLVILGVALTGIAGAIALFGQMKIGTMIKGIVSIAGTLVVLAIGLTAMTGTLGGSAALLIAAGALAVLAPTLAFLGTLKWSTIFKGLAAIALALGTLAIVGALAGPGLVSLGVSLLPLAGVFLITAAGVMMFAKALQLLGENGTKGVSVMVTALTVFVAAIPKLVIDFLKGLLTVADEIVKMAPRIVTGLGKVLDIVIAFVIEMAPKLGVAIGRLVDTIVLVVSDNAPKLIAAGWKLLLDFLSGIDDNIGEVVTRVTSIITKFLNGLAENAPQIVTAGANVVVAYLNGVAKNLYRVVSAAGNMVTSFIDGITNKLPDMVSAGARLIRTFLHSIAEKIPGMMNAATDVIVAFIDGLGNHMVRIVNAGTHMIKRFIHGIAKAGNDLANAAFDTLTTFLNHLAETIRTRGKELRDAGWNVADAIVDGMKDGFHELKHKVKKGLGDVITFMPRHAMELLKANSPSKVFHEIGGFAMQGLANGVTQGGRSVNASVSNAATGMVDHMTKHLSKVPDLLDGVMDMDPVISPVLDLSGVHKDAKQLSSLTNVAPIKANVSLNAASALSQDVTAAQADQAATAGPKEVKVEFNQTNTSPKALSEIELYRRTNNQLSQAKRELAAVI